jgi:hypothetical protein
VRHHDITLCLQSLHSDGQRAGYFLRTMWTLLSSLGYGEPSLFIGTLRLLRGNSYLWHVCVVIYKKSTTDHIHRIGQVVEASSPRWMFEGVWRDATREALAVL